MAVMDEILARFGDAMHSAYDEAFEEGRRHGIKEAVDALLALIGGKVEEVRVDVTPIEPEADAAPTIEQLAVSANDGPTLVCKQCGRELPATSEFFRIYKRTGTVMQPCRECFKGAPFNKARISPKSVRKVVTLKERFPKCPREDCHKRAKCNLVDDPTSCESFMMLHQGEE